MDDRPDIPQQHAEEKPTAGQEALPFQGTPMKSLKIPEDGDSNIAPEPPRGSILGEVVDEEARPSEQAPMSAEHMRVLVAEDDPVNSRIIKKRLEKLGHSVTLTVNGDECAGAFSDKPQDFDVVLMDMQVC
jgi:hypothetical protein